MSCKVIFLGTRPVGYQCLKYLLSRQRELDFELIEVVTTQAENAFLSADLGALAKDAGVPVAADLAPDGPLVDLLISVQHENVLTAAQLDRSTGQAVNLHMAPLPEYRGAGQFSFAILNGEKRFGTTLHAMEKKVDAGPILAQQRFEIAPHWTVKDLYEHTVEQSVALFKKELAPLINRELSSVPQDQFPAEGPLHFYLRTDIFEHKCIDPDWPLDKIDRTVRAFDMPGFEPAYMEYEGRRIYLRAGYDGN